MKKKSFLFGYSQVVTWFLAWVFMSFCNVTSASIYRPQVAALHGLDFATILQGTTYTSIIAIFLVLLYPKIIQRIGAKKLSVIVTFLAAIMYFLYPRIPNVTVIIILGGLLQVFSQGFCTICTMILVSKWFPRTKGRVMGIITAAGIVSSSVFLPIFNKVLAASGIVMAMTVFAIAMAVWGFANIFWMRETPEEVGLLPDNKPLTDEDRVKLSMAANAKKNSSLTYGKLIRVPKFWMVSIGWGLILCAIMIFSTTCVAFITKRGYEIGVAVTLQAIAGWASTACSVGSGFLETKIGIKPTMWIIVGMVVVGLAISVLTAGTALPVVVIGIGFVLVRGAFGAPNNLFSSQVLSLSGVKDYAVFYGLFTSVYTLLQNLNGFIGGTCLKITGDYYLAYGIGIAMAIIGAILTMLAGYKNLNLTASEAEVK